MDSNYKYLSDKREILDSYLDKYDFNVSLADFRNGLVNDIPYQKYYDAQLKVRAMEGGSSLPVKAFMHAPLFDNE